MLQAPIQDIRRGGIHLIALDISRMGTEDIRSTIKRSLERKTPIYAYCSQWDEDSRELVQIPEAQALWKKFAVEDGYIGYLLTAKDHGVELNSSQALKDAIVISVGIFDRSDGTNYRTNVPPGLIDQIKQESLINFKRLYACAKCHNVTKPLLQCTRCHDARYCSKGCQKADWKTHKAHCG